MSTTFISFIGKGRIEGSGYKVADYDFGDGKVFRSKCFAEAVRESGRYSFDEVLFVGTPTSAWSSLLESDKTSEDLCLHLYERETQKVELLPDSELAQQLQKRLAAIWGKPVRLHINPKNLTAENSEGIFDAYVKELLDVGKDILLDITHSFRWMPILLTSALSFKDAFHQGGSEIKIIYGELGEGEKISPVRCLDILVKERRISDAISQFFQKFEPDPLEEYIKPHWSKGADAIKTVGQHIQGNLFLPLLFDCSNPGFTLGEPLKKLRNALRDFRAVEQPAWVVKVHQKLNSIFETLSDGDAPERLCRLAEHLAARKLYGQALMAVCLAAEHSLVLANHLEKFPDYDTLKELKKKFCSCAGGRQAQWLRNDIDKMRNLIAHGGMLPDRTNPSSDALPKQFENALARLKDLREYLRNDYHGPVPCGSRR